jgi:hypothetical protein
MAVVIAQSQAAAASSALSALRAAGVMGASGSAAAVSHLPGLAGFGQGAQSASAHAVTLWTLGGTGQTGASQHVAALSALGSLETAVTAQALNVNTARITATLGSLRAKGSQAAAQSLQAVSALGALRSAITVHALNVNTAVIAATLPRFRAAATGNASDAVHAVGRIALDATAVTSAEQATHVSARLPRLWASLPVAARAIAYIDSTLGALGTSASVQPPPAGYAPDGHYYAALAARPFYATLAARPFYAPAWARPFYILSNPDVTPTFDTLDPAETQVLTLDASADLDDGETLTSIKSITATQQAGVSETALVLTGGTINGAALNLTVNGKPVTIAIGCGVQVIASGGSSGCRYLVAATCLTSNPNKVLTLKGILPVFAG